MAATVKIKLNAAFYQEMAGKMSRPELRKQMRLEAEDKLDDINWDRELQRVTATSKTGIVRRKRKARRQRRA